MTDHIYSFNKNEFPFSDITLANPHGLQGGAYFSKLKLLGNSVILQTPKCKTKNGIIKTDKKIYCDLLFNKDDDNVIEFLDELEDKIKTLIFDKKDKWFHSEMDMDTIDYHWQNILRPYKGSFILLRCFIKKPKSTLNSHPPVQIYDEDENLLDLDKVTKDKTIMSLINITGLKFTSQSFSLEFNLKQVMVLKDTIFRNKCLIKKTKTELPKEKDNSSTDSPSNSPPPITLKEVSKSDTDKNNNTVIENIQPLTEVNEVNQITEDVVNLEDDSELNQVELKLKGSENTQDMSNEIQDVSNEKLNENKVDISNNLNDSETPSQPIDEEPKQVLENTLEKTNDFDNFELDEVNLDIPEDSGFLHLRQPNEVYLEIYREVKQKAKEAKKKAIEAYLEAKRIKSLYLLDEIESSDDESELLAITKDHELN